MYPRHIRKAVERKVDVGECRHVLSTQLGVDLLIKEPLKRQSSRSDAVEDGRIILLPVQIPIEVLIVKIEPLCLECKFDVEAVCAAMLQIYADQRTPKRSITNAGGKEVNEVCRRGGPDEACIGIGEGRSSEKKSGNRGRAAHSRSGFCARLEKSQTERQHLRTASDLKG